MKTLAIIIACSALSVLNASAQKKLWTWKTEDKTQHREIAFVTMSEDGSGALALYECSLKPLPVRGFPDITSILLVWVDANGKVLLSRRSKIQTPVTLFDPESPRWELSIATPGKLIACDDNQMFLFEVKAGKGVLVKTLPIYNKITFKSSPFSGWVEHTGFASYVLKGRGPIGTPGFPGYIPAVPDQKFKSTDSFTAWKF